MKIIAATLFLLFATGCAKPDCLYYQDVELKSQVTSSSDPVKTVMTELNVVPEGQDYPLALDQIEIIQESGTRIQIESVLHYLVNGRSEFSADEEGTLFATADIFCKGASSARSKYTFPNGGTFRVENPVLVGNIHDDSVDPDFASVSVLHVHINDDDFLTECGLNAPFEVSLRFETDASMVDERTAPSIHGCKDR